MLKPHETKALVDDAVSLLIDACDTDDVLWSTRATGQDSEEAEASGYLAGYRDALVSIQRLVGHDDPKNLSEYLDVIRDEMLEAQQEVEEDDLEQTHFWNA